MKTVRLADVEHMPASSFRYNNHVSWLRIPSPSHLNLRSGQILIDKPFRLVGWCDVSVLPKELRINRDGQVALMFWSEEDGNVWAHYPLYEDQDEHAAHRDRDMAVFHQLEGESRD